LPTMAAIVPVQCFIARRALGWSVRHLARAAEVSRERVMRFERGYAQRATTVEAIQGALERAGVIWIDAKDGGPGARLPPGRGYFFG
jgi:transcriptional regulator with XRE-family HTH domain